MMCSSVANEMIIDIAVVTDDDDGLRDYIRDRARVARIIECSSTPAPPI
jgi:hypothetical protein